MKLEMRWIVYSDDDRVLEYRYKASDNSPWTDWIIVPRVAWEKI